MMDKQWALKYILDPLTGPEPSQETGPGSSHVRTAAFIPPPPPSTPPPRYTSPAFASPAYCDDLHPTSSPATPAHFLPQYQHHDNASHYYDLSPTYLDLAISPPDYWSVYFFDSGSVSNMASYDARRVSLLLGRHHVDHDRVTSSPHSQRSRSLSPNFNNPFAASSSSHPSDLPRSRNSGDMSDRPLDKIRAEARAADRRHKQRKRTTYTDSIDRLDTIGSPYHHAGPYDAALPCRNRNKKYSPLAAVQESNMEAIRATPRENLIDSLSRNVPLQGTASVAPGAMDLSGNVMDYAEGADLMREADAPGGAYKRWTGIPYHPEDLKGKGEPSFTLERDLKSKKRQKHSSMPASAFEMLPGITTRQRPASLMPDSLTAKDVFSGDLQRGNSTSKKLGEGIKRRLGSFRRKKAVATEEVH